MASPSPSSRVLVFFGSDEGQAAAAAQAAFSRITDGQDGWGDEMIDGAAATVDDALSIIHRCIAGLQMVNMFGGQKVIWLKGATFMGDSPQGTRSEAIVKALDELLQTLNKLPDETYFILQAMDMDKRRVFFKGLQKIAKLQECAKIDQSKAGWERELSNLVTQLAREKNLRFTADAMHLFIHRVHENSRQISNELDKLAVYLGEEQRPLELQDIEQMVPVSRDGIIFEISRALERRDARTAIALIDAQLERGESAIAIIRATFIPTFSSLFRVALLREKYAIRAGGSYGQFESEISALPQQAQKLLPLKKDGTVNFYGFYNAAKTAHKDLNVAQTTRALKACAQVDRQLVSTSLDPRMLLHQLVVKVTN